MYIRYMYVLYKSAAVAVTFPLALSNLEAILSRELGGFPDRRPPFSHLNCGLQLNPIVSFLYF